MSIDELAEQLGTTVAVLDSLQNRFDERAQYWSTIAAWNADVRSWTTSTQPDPQWSELPNDDEYLLGKSPIRKETRVVALTEAKQLARAALGVDGRGKRKHPVLAALDDVYDEVTEICGKVPHYQRSAKETGGLVESGFVSQRQRLLCDFLSPNYRYTESNLASLSRTRRNRGNTN